MTFIKNQLVSGNVLNKRTYGKGNRKKYIVVHQTGNKKIGANAKSHANLQSNLNSREASWHLTVDDKEVIQSIPDDYRCWATGDGRQVNGGNYNGIHIELCINSDNDYHKTLLNGAKAVAIKLKQYGLGIDRVKRHFDFMKKNCPEQLMSGYMGYSWSYFLDLVRKEMGRDHIIKDNLKITGLLDVPTVTEMQRFFGTVEDGFISAPSLMVRSLQSYLNGKGYNLVLDGHFGKATTRALQSYYGTTVDGVISKPSLVIIQLQYALNKGTI